jgi:hypothetical protein
MIFIFLITIVYASTMSIQGTFPNGGEIQFVNPTPSDGTNKYNNTAEINISTSLSNLKELKYNWNGTNYTYYDDSLILMMNFNQVGADDEFSENTLNSNRWITSSSTNSNLTIVNGKLRMDVESGGSKSASVYSRNNLSGDFDIYVHYNLIDFPAQSGGSSSDYLATYLNVKNVAGYSDNNNWSYIIRRNNKDNTKSYLFRGGLLNSTTDTSGYFRLVRVGSTITGYILNTSGVWLPMGYRSTFTTDDVYIYAGTQSTAGCTDNLIVDYDNFTVIKGEIADEYSLSNNGGIINGANWTTSGKYGGALEFNSNNDYIDVNSISDNLNIMNGTVSAWFYPKGNGVNDYVFFGVATGSNRIYMNHATGDILRVSRGNPTSSLNLETNIELNQWYHMVLTWNNETLYGYLNGQYVGSQNYANNISTTGIYRIGGTTGVDQSANGTIDEVRIWSRTLTAEEVYQQYISNLYKLSYTQWYLEINQSKNSTDLLDYANYTYQAFALDSSDNFNSTELRAVTGNTIPMFIYLTYTPNSTGELDPNININININTSDAENNFDSAIFQWKNTTVSEWSEITMTNLTEISNYTHLNITFNLPLYESNITFRIKINDTVGETSYSTNYTLESFWDCTWIVNSDLGATSGWDENKFIGNITINNTGDANHSTGCNLDFRLTYDLSEGRIYYDGEYIKNLITVNNLPAKSNQTIEINATFLSEIKQESVIITLEELRERSITKYRNITATLVSNQIGPYLYQTLTSYPTSVYLTPGIFSLNAYLRNLMGSTTINENNTAYNVSFYWTIPTGLTNKSGNTSIEFTNITNNEAHYNNLEINFSDLASITQGVKSISLVSYGYNLSGDLIVDANGKSNQTNSINVSFLCYNTSDGICVTSCGYLLDSDCTAPTTETTVTPTTSSSGSGGGGGSSARRIESIETSADFQLIRGEQNEVKIIFENKDQNQSLKDLTFSITGAIAKYIEINPTELSYLGPAQNVEVILTITSPTYIELGKQELVIVMSGKKGSNSYNDYKRITLEIHELSVQRAYEMLNESRTFIQQLNELNLSSEELTKLLNESEKEILIFNLEKVRDNYNIIKEQSKYALDSYRMILELESLIKSAEKKGIDVSESTKLLKLAKLSLERKEFEQAYNRIKDAQLTYALEIKGEFGKLSYYLKEYPGEISLATILLIIFSCGTYKISQLRKIKNRIKELKNEERILNELMRVVQKDCFKDKKMSMSEYETAMKEYNKKLSAVIEELIEMETKRVHMLRFTSKNRMLKFEKEKIISMIKELQRDYMKNKTIETKTFELKIESFNKRLSEIEEKIATIEAKKAMRGLGISLRIPQEKN